MEIILATFLMCQDKPGFEVKACQIKMAQCLASAKSSPDTIDYQRLQACIKEK